MSDDIVDIEAQQINEIPNETLTKDGMNIPDPAFIDETSEEGLQQIQQMREEVANLPKFPSEWQEGYKDENTKGFDENLKLPVNVTIKQQEINKLIKKYKRYMKSNLREINRINNANVES